MRAFVAATLFLAMFIGCSKPEPGATPGTASAAPGTPATPATPQVAKVAFVQKGIAADKVIVGYIQSSADDSQCAVITDVPAKKENFAKEGAQVAEMMKGKLVASCPTDKVVGTCKAGFGILTNYSGPKYTADTAKADCIKGRGTWVD